MNNLMSVVLLFALVACGKPPAADKPTFASATVSPSNRDLKDPSLNSNDGDQSNPLEAHPDADSEKAVPPNNIVGAVGGIPVLICALASDPNIRQGETAVACRFEKSGKHVLPKALGASISLSFEGPKGHTLTISSQLLKNSADYDFGFFFEGMDRETQIKTAKSTTVKLTLKSPSGSKVVTHKIDEILNEPLSYIVKE